MEEKGAAYERSGDRLAFFKEAATDQGLLPEAALWGMLAKQLTSLRLMAADPAAVADRPVWGERLSDAHNYLFLLEALVAERHRWPPG